MMYCTDDINYSNALITTVNFFDFKSLIFSNSVTHVYAK